MKASRLFLIFLCVLFLPIIRIQAQAVDDTSGSSVQDLISGGIEIVLFPQIPGPNESVHATLNSTTVDLDISDITWVVNGKNLQSGQGLKDLTFMTGSTGTKTTIEAIISSSGGSITKKITLNSADVDLLWEGRGYTPPFYKGKTLWGFQTQMNLVAVPHIMNSSGQEINPSTLIYKWIKDGSILGNVSGAGKNSLTISDSVLSMPISIEVQVFINRDTLVANKVINFAPGKQEVLIYESSPLYGILFNKEVGSGFSTMNTEFSFVAIPLFFSTLNRESKNIVYDWQPNNADSGSKSIMTYRNPDNTSGASNVSIGVNSSFMITQTANKTFKVQFNNASGL